MGGVDGQTLVDAAKVAEETAIDLLEPVSIKNKLSSKDQKKHQRITVRVFQHSE